VRVLDLTVVWAGPYATMQLGDLGAEVIRLDNPNLFPTATRGAIPRPRPGKHRELGWLWGAFADDDPGPRPWNRVGPFAVHARNKLSATLDLRTALGRETFLRLVDVADVVVENNSAKVLDQLRLGWDELHRRNPRLVVVRMPSIGLEGPYRGYVGFGAHVEAMCGLTALRGYPDLDVSANGATYFMDPFSGTAATFATLAALRRRDRSGEGELVEVAQAENLAQLIGDHLIDAARTGRRHGTLGNRDPVRAPQGVYPCTGADRWVAISVGDDQEWAALAALSGISDERFVTAAGRHRHHDDLDLALAAWIAPQDRWAVTRRLQCAGIAAGPVLDEADLLADPHLQARGFFRLNGSDDLGQWRFPGHHWRWDGPPFAWGPINQLGRDNDAVYRGIAGLDDTEMAALAAEGHLRLDYVDAAGQPL
jgi:crotonobetainyl-CoA:carnitine CoA-transferase CaiB-like acyl-CoA transferase